ncbi:RNA polymerase sigma factor [Streptomyces nitrosporeus]|uniref:RNA polymerase sigma factor n=1 Tax=Streptomyces nitrosporeus TaxID=28894 RepID=UPI00331B0C9C
MSDDHARFTAMYDDFRQRVWAYAVSQAGRTAADDVVSETFTVAWRRFHEIPQEPLPWLLGVARNVLRAHHRADARSSVPAGTGTWAKEAVTGDIADDVTERLTMLRALDRLSQTDREVLLLVAWHGLTPAQAGTVVGCSTATMRVRLHRARGRLRKAADSRQTKPPARRLQPFRRTNQEAAL